MSTIPSSRTGGGTRKVTLPGFPVVAGRAPGVVDAVLDGETGLLVEPGDLRAILPQARGQDGRSSGTGPRATSQCSRSWAAGSGSPSRAWS